MKQREGRFFAEAKTALFMSLESQNGMCCARKLWYIDGVT